MNSVLFEQLSRNGMERRSRQHCAKLKHTSGLATITCIATARPHRIECQGCATTFPIGQERDIGSLRSSKLSQRGGDETQLHKSRPRPNSRSRRVCRELLQASALLEPATRRIAHHVHNHGEDGASAGFHVELCAATAKPRELAHFANRAAL